MLQHNKATYNEIAANMQSHIIGVVVKDFREISAALTTQLINEDNVDQKSIIQGKLRVLADLITDYTRPPASMTPGVY